MVSQSLEESLLGFLRDNKFACQSTNEFILCLEGCIEKLPENEPFDGDLFVESEFTNESEYELPSLPEEFFSSITTTCMDNSFDANWLRQRCATINSALSVDELCSHVVGTLSAPSAAAESDLLDLLGFEAVAVVGDLITNREAILKNCKETDFAASTAPLAIPQPTLPGQKVVINTESSKRAVKEYHRLQANGIIPQNLEPIPSFDNELAGRQLKQAFGAGNIKPVQLPNIYFTKKPVLSGLGGKFALPQGTVHNDFVDHEEFIIPYPKDSGELTKSIRPLLIKDMDELLRKAFPGYSQLNHMQSAVFPMAHGSNENMLICAPTGAGKTDVAMLTVLKILRDHLISLEPNVKIAKSDFKIVYIAPMKALAAEVALKFSQRLRPYRVVVREYTGDMQLSRQEVNETQMLVTTPEKWDVITRKSQGDVDLVQKVKLLIIDEVHLLQDDRGPVIEALVSRTLREVEISQRLIRIVGLSATLPNYIDVATFLRVDPYNGLFVFGDAFRPVPLSQQFVGIKGRNNSTINENMSRVCFEKCKSFLIDNHQVMVFVHSRNDTIKTAKMLFQTATDMGCVGLFTSEQETPQYRAAKKAMERSRNKELQALFAKGLGFHHAGMLRSDRSMIEQLFSDGYIRVLVCTSTLAWGVNLPAHAVIIKGTQVYDQSKGDFVQLGVLDVLQIFGRAGRPQFETHGEGIILTAHENMARYIGAVMSQIPIESQFLAHLADNLNAEVALGTVASIHEAVTWLKYSYLYVRMLRNPTSYGITPKDLLMDPELEGRLEKICRDAAAQLRNCGMISFDSSEQAGVVRIRDVGRIAAAFYLTIGTIETFGKSLKPTLTEEDVIAVVSSAAEFNNFRVREEELDELDNLRDGAPLRVKHDTTTPAGKASLLIMAHISRYQLDTFSLVSDSNYIAQNGGRILRALFEILKSQGWMQASLRCLSICVAFERKRWPIQHPLWQFEKIPIDTLRVLESKGKVACKIEGLLEMSKPELDSLTGSPRAGELVYRFVRHFPRMVVEAKISPVTDAVLRIDCHLTPEYTLDPTVHSIPEFWWIFVENPLAVSYVHCDQFSVARGQSHVARKVSFFITLPDPFPPQLYVRVVSDRWLQAQTSVAVSLSNLKMPRDALAMHTELLPLPPVPISALKDPRLEEMYSEQFLFFNGVQTQAFEALHHGDFNVLVGAPTGSGKTIVAELAIWNALRRRPDGKIVYVAPLKALVKERLADWSQKFFPLGLSVTEISGDVAYDSKDVRDAQVIITTPEKIDSVTRKSPWFVNNISLLVLDEIHLLGGGRGHVLEVLVTRLRRATAGTIRILGLSTALANASDLAGWMDIPPEGLFNFPPSVRPVPLQVHIEGFAGRQYCPRMAIMNKPVYSAILSHSPDKPVLVFVSSRRQTRLTAMALVSFCANDNAPYRFVHCDGSELDWAVEQAQDSALKHTLQFGIALHHAGLVEEDRRICERLFLAGSVQVMVATSTLAWGLNFPAHLVVVKGTEYFDAQSHTYVDFPLTDVMQMIGRAGRPQFDKEAKAVILVQDIKKDFYKKFLYESFPLESGLQEQDRLADHLIAEIAMKRVRTTTEAVAFVKETFLAIRVSKNPNYYGVEDGTPVLIDEYLSGLVVKAFEDLEKSHCLTFINRKHSDRVESTEYGQIAANFYLSHRTLKLFAESIGTGETFASLLRLLALANEFSEAPVRHNEDKELPEFCTSAMMQSHWTKLVGPSMKLIDWTSPHSKVLVLLIAWMAGVTLPFLDFVTDTRTILDQATRVASAMLEVTRLKGAADSFVSAIWLGQSLFQGCLPDDVDLWRQFPYQVNIPRKRSMRLPQLLHATPRERDKFIDENIVLPDGDARREILSILTDRLPRLKVSYQQKPSGSIMVECRDERAKLPEVAYCRHVQRLQPEAGRLVLIDCDTNEIVYHQRRVLEKRMTVEIPPLAPTLDAKVKLLLLLENYLGLDQELDVNVSRVD